MERTNHPNGVVTARTIEHTSKGARFDNFGVTIEAPLKIETWSGTYGMLKKRIKKVPSGTRYIRNKWGDSISSAFLNTMKPFNGLVSKLVEERNRQVKEYINQYHVSPEQAYRDYGTGLLQDRLTTKPATRAELEEQFVAANKNYLSRSSIYPPVKFEQYESKLDDWKKRYHQMFEKLIPQGIDAVRMAIYQLQTLPNDHALMAVKSSAPLLAALSDPQLRADALDTLTKRYPYLIPIYSEQLTVLANERMEPYVKAYTTIKQILEDKTSLSPEEVAHYKKEALSLACSDSGAYQEINARMQVIVRNDSISNLLKSAENAERQVWELSDQATPFTSNRNASLEILKHSLQTDGPKGLFLTIKSLSLQYRGVSDYIGAARQQGMNNQEIYSIVSAPDSKSSLKRLAEQLKGVHPYYSNSINTLLIQLNENLSLTLTDKKNLEKALGVTAPDGIISMEEIDIHGKPVSTDDVVISGEDIIAAVAIRKPELFKNGHTIIGKGREKAPNAHVITNEQIKDEIKSAGLPKIRVDDTETTGSELTDIYRDQLYAIAKKHKDSPSK